MKRKKIHVKLLFKNITIRFCWFDRRKKGLILSLILQEVTYGVEIERNIFK